MDPSRKSWLLAFYRLTFNPAAASKNVIPQCVTLTGIKTCIHAKLRSETALDSKESPLSQFRLKLACAVHGASSVNIQCHDPATQPDFHTYYISYLGHPVYSGVSRI